MLFSTQEIVRNIRSGAIAPRDFAWLARACLRWLDNGMHKSKTDLYSTHEMSLESVISSVTRCSKSDLERYFGEFHDNVDLRVLFAVASPGALSQIEASLLYVICRIVKPSTAVETGVADGVSSTATLAALDRNQTGQLYSVDFATPFSRTMPWYRKGSGWIIPPRLRDRWNRVSGESRYALRPLLSRIAGVDVFLHDSEHSYSNMMREFETVWPFLTKGGVILADDVYLNDALLDFASQKGRSFVILSEAHKKGFHIGAMRK